MVTTPLEDLGSVYDVEAVREQFPILRRRVKGRRVVYLDSASTSQVPRPVIERMRRHLETHNANVGRSAHTLGVETTTAYEAARATVAGFVGARSAAEVVFTRNATEAINLVAYALSTAAVNGGSGPLRLGPGDVVVVSEMEHHSNLVPWQQACARTGATLRLLPLTDDGRLDLSDLDRIVDERTALVSVVHVSNILGTLNPVGDIIRRGRAVGALTMLDASQSVPHMPVDVSALGADFVAFTGHKMCGPTGVGVLWARRELLEATPPFLTGGGMVDRVDQTAATFVPPPARFEAGTPATVPVIGLAAAVEFLSEVGMGAVHRHERRLTAHALAALAEVPQIRVLGPPRAEERGSAISFTLDGVPPSEVGRLLDEEGIEVRVGRHCAAPVCARYGVPATVRASLALYNTEAEVDALVAALGAISRRLGATTRG